MIRGNDKVHVEERDDDFYETMFVMGMEESVHRAGRRNVRFEHDGEDHYIVFDGLDDTYRQHEHRVYHLTKEWCDKHDREQIVRHVEMFCDRRQRNRVRFAPHVAEAVSIGRRVYEEMNGGRIGATVLLSVSVHDRNGRPNLRFEIVRHGDNGHGAWHAFEFVVSTVADPTAEVVEEACRRELKRILTRQHKLTEIHGTSPKLVAVDDIDLDAYTCDSPLLALIKKIAGDEWRALARSIIHADSNFVAEKHEFRLADGTMAEFPPLMQAETVRNRLRGRFRLGPRVRWSRGVLVVQRMVMPQTLLSAITGGPISAVIHHELLADDLTITSVTVDSDGSDTTTVAFTIAGSEVPFE